MSLTIQPVQGDFVAVVNGIDLRQRLSDVEVEALHTGMDDFAVLVFKDQPIDNEQQLAFSQQLGTLQPAVGNNVTPQSQRRLEASFSDVSNLDGKSRIQDRNDRGRLFGFGNRLWHSDASFREVPAKYSILSARALPERDGTTEFADMRAAYDSLDGSTRETLEGLVAVHSQMYSRSLLGFTEFTEEERRMFAPVRHSMVRTLPGNGRKSLYVGSHAGEIEGWPVPEARMFIFDLMEHATRPENVHVHHWTLHDVVMWDNRQVVHRVRRYDDLNEIRDMRRTTLMGDGKTL